MIYLIAGHHDNDSGAVAHGLKEADLTKRVRDLTYDAIKRIRPKQMVTRDDDKDTLSQVISKISPKIQENDLLIDFHYNSASSTATGVECVVSDYASKYSIDTATYICNIVSNISGLKNRGVKREKDTPRKKLGILRMKGGTVVVELGFISNLNDVQSIDKHLHWICEDMAHVILQNYDRQN